MTRPHVCWVAGVSGTGVAAQSRVVTAALADADCRVSTVRADPLGTDHAAPSIMDDAGVHHPVDSLADTLLTLDPDIVVFHSANQHVRQAHGAIQPHAVTCARLGVNFREQLLAGPQFSSQIPDLVDFLHSVDHIIASSGRAARTMQTHGVRDARLTRIPTAINPDDVREPDPDAPDAVGVIGRLCKVKNQLCVVEAISGLRECDPPLTPPLKVAGEQSQNDGVPQAMRGLLPKLAPNFRTRLFGHVDDPMADFYPEIGVHAHPSWTENCPQTLLEAAVAGVPSVVSDMAWADAYPFVDWPRCPPDDPRAWTDELHRLLTDDEYRVSQARRQQQAVLDNYTIDIVIEDYLALFDELLDAYATFKVPSEVRAV